MFKNPPQEKRGSGVEEIFRKYRHKIYWLALSIAHNEKDAEDILQNTFLKIIRKIDTFRQQSRLATWIYRVTYNEGLMYLRKKRAALVSLNALKEYAVKIAPGLALNRAGLADRELLQKELRERVDIELKNIPIKYRMPLLLHKYHGLSLKDCAAILNIQNASLKTRLHRAYLLLKEEMGGYFNDRLAREGKTGPRCSLSKEFIHNYAQGKLTRKEEVSFKRHIKGCPACNSFLDTYRRPIRVTGSLECRDIPPELEERILSLILRKKS